MSKGSNLLHKEEKRHGSVKRRTREVAITDEAGHSQSQQINIILPSHDEKLNTPRKGGKSAKKIKDEVKSGKLLDLKRAGSSRSRASHASKGSKKR